MAYALLALRVAVRAFSADDRPVSSVTRFKLGRLVTFHEVIIEALVGRNDKLELKAPDIVKRFGRQSCEVVQTIGLYRNCN